MAQLRGWFARVVLSSICAGLLTASEVVGDQPPTQVPTRSSRSIRPVGMVDLAPLYPGLREAFVCDDGRLLLMPIMALQAEQAGKAVHAILPGDAKGVRVSVAFLPYPKGVFEIASERIKAQFQDQRFRLTFFGKELSLEPANIHPMSLSRLTCSARRGSNTGTPIASVAIDREGPLVEASFVVEFPFVDQQAADAFIKELDAGGIHFEFVFESPVDEASNARFQMSVPRFARELENSKATNNTAHLPDVYSLGRVKRALANAGTFLVVERTLGVDPTTSTNTVVQRLLREGLLKSSRLLMADQNVAQRYEKSFLDGESFKKSLIDQFEKEDNVLLSQTSQQIVDRLYPVFESSRTDAAQEEALVGLTLDQAGNASGTLAGYFSAIGVAYSSIGIPGDASRPALRDHWRKARANPELKSRDAFASKIRQELADVHEQETGHRLAWDGKQFVMVALTCFEIAPDLVHSKATINENLIRLNSPLIIRNYAIHPGPIPGTSYRLDTVVEDLQTSINTLKKLDLPGQLSRLNAIKHSKIYLTRQRGIFTPDNKRATARRLYDDDNGAGWTESHIKNGDIVYIEYNTKTRSNFIGTTVVGSPKQGNTTIHATLIETIFVPDTSFAFQNWGNIAIYCENSPIDVGIRAWGLASTESNAVRGTFYFFHRTEE